MKQWVKRIFESCFDREIPLRGRLINICLVLCTIGGVIAPVATIIQGSSLLSVFFITLLPIGTTILQIWVRRTGNYRVAGFLFAIVLCDIVFPIIFLTSGGIQSGMQAYFLLGSVLIFLLLGENTRDCILMTVTYLVVNSTAIILSLHYPGLVTGVADEAMIYFDIVVAFFLSTMLIEMALWFQTRMYKVEQQVANDAVKAKNEFLASMSHELRTPLNAIIGLSELQMKTKEKLPLSTQSDIRNIHESGKTLLFIINDILDISKIGSGKFELICAEYNTADMINDTVGMNKVRIGSKPITFEVYVDSSIPAVLYGDGLRIRQIFNNMLSNAFKYTQEGVVRLEVRCRKSGDDVVMETKISDTGIGIRKADIPSLFGKYNKLDDVRSRNIEGTGLGLAITYDLVEMMNGSIKVESIYGKGSAFSFRIPQKAVGNATIGRDTADALAEFTYKAIDDNDEAFTYISHKGRRALIVDDVELNLYVAGEMLAPYEMTIDFAESGKKAIELIRDETVKYDIIFMDHMMPGIDGFEATKIIRRDIDTSYAKSVPIVALTANALVGNEEIFLNNGFQGFLSKPMDTQKLDEVLKELLV